MLAGKHIAVFCVQSFNLEKQITDSLQKLGASVKYFDERPQNSLVYKAILRYVPQLYTKKVTDYYSNIQIILEKESLDYLLIIRGEVVPVWFINAVKECQPNCKTIYYTSDSFKNNPKGLEIAKLTDTAYTFDSEDAEKHNLRRLPLYFPDSYTQSRSKYVSRTYDFCFIGTVHSDRMKLVSKIVKQLKPQKPFVFFYIQSLIVLLIRMIRSGSLLSGLLNNVKFTPLSRDNMQEVLLNSKIVLDIHHPHQTGLTMRTIEALGAECKVITTNDKVRDYPFYNANNICVIDRRDPIVPPTFLETAYVPIDKAVYAKYSTSSWLQQLFA